MNLNCMCEVLSPSTQSHDRVAKMRIYGREGVKHVWLVDPSAQLLEVFRREGDTWLRLLSAGSEEKVHAEPFDAIELELAALWER